MLPEIEAIRRALASLDALDDETREALSTLELALAEIDRLPDPAKVREVVAETADTLSSDEAASPALSEKWAGLKDQLVHWEEEHPSLVLAIGRVSNSLAAFGL